MLDILFKNFYLNLPLESINHKNTKEQVMIEILVEELTRY